MFCSATDGAGINTIYTQTYSTPESARALVGFVSNISRNPPNTEGRTHSTQTDSKGHPTQPLSLQTSNASTDSGLSMSGPHYIDPNQNPALTHPTHANQKDTSKSKYKQNYLHPPDVSGMMNNGYIDVLDSDSERSDTHENPQTIMQLSQKYRGRAKDRKKGKRKPRMPSPPREQVYENQESINRLKKWKNRISRSLGLSHDYSNSSEIEKIKRGGRASAKISAYKVKNIINQFEKNTNNQDTNNAVTNPSYISDNGGRVHNNLGKSVSMPGGSLNSPVPRPNPAQRHSAYSMDSEGYMKPVLYTTKTASYLDLNPDTVLTVADSSNNSSGSMESNKYHNVPVTCVPPPPPPPSSRC